MIYLIPKGKEGGVIRPLLCSEGQLELHGLKFGTPCCMLRVLGSRQTPPYGATPPKGRFDLLLPATGAHPAAVPDTALPAPGIPQRDRVLLHVVLLQERDDFLPVLFGEWELPLPLPGVPGRP